MNNKESEVMENQFPGGSNEIDFSNPDDDELRALKEKAAI